VAHNRRRRDRIVCAGEVVRRSASGIAGEQPILERTASSLSDVVDDAFRSHCRVGAVRGDEVVVHVRPAEMVAAMRLRWSGVVASALADRGVRRVVFVFGDGGSDVV
jgi:hypothetical protein